MRISLDTNVWIFGIVGSDKFCEAILLNLAQFKVIVPNQVRVELERNLSQQNLKKFYYFIKEFNIDINYEQVPEIYITMFEGKGLKKGDAIIGGFAEWQKIEAIVSDNRDFLRGLSPEHYFEVMSPQEFCTKFRL
jgi:predicted nucleic acid-binding protein